MQCVSQSCVTMSQCVQSACIQTAVDNHTTLRCRADQRCCSEGNLALHCCLGRFRASANGGAGFLLPCLSLTNLEDSYAAAQLGHTLLQFPLSTAQECSCSQTDARSRLAVAEGTLVLTKHPGACQQQGMHQKCVV